MKGVLGESPKVIIMLYKEYYFTVAEHDYFEHFGAQRTPVQTYIFSSLVEAFKAQQKSLSKDIHWESDHDRRTSKLKTRWVYTIEKQDKHGFVFGHKPTESEKLWAKYNALSFEEQHQHKGRIIKAAAKEYELEESLYSTPLQHYVVKGWDGEIIEEFDALPFGPFLSTIMAEDHLEESSKGVLTDTDWAIKTVGAIIATAVSKENKSFDLRVDMEW